MRISRADPDDPTGQRRRHFEISIDSPFTVLDCRATQANTSLPSYPDGCASEGGAPHYRQPASCGCPDAQVLSMPPSPTSSTGTLTMTASPDQPEMPTAPPAAHVHRSTTSTSSASNHTTSSTAAASSASSATASTSAAISPNGTVPLDSSLANTGDFRPIHLLRHPSFNPPAFDADVAPPPAPVDDPLGDETDGQPRGSIMTPPPRYDSVVGTPSVDGLADYFARLASYDQARRGSRASMASAAARAAATGTGNAAAAAAAPPSVAEEDEPRSPGSHSTASAGMGGAASSSSDEDGSDDDDEHVLELALRRRRLTERSGRVNVGNPRTPGAQTPAGGPDGLTLVTSRSFEIERPTFNPDLSLASIGSRRREAPGA